MFSSNMQVALQDESSITIKVCIVGTNCVTMKCKGLTHVTP